MIAGLVARNGQGKTLGAVYLFVLPCWLMGRPVASNIGLRPEALGFAPELYVPVESMGDLLRVGEFPHEPGRSITNNQPAMLLLDEITSVLPSRDFARVPPELQKLTQQMRKPRVSPVVWTAPSYGRADKLLREVTTVVVEARAVLPWLFSRVPGRFEWPQHRYFSYRFYDGQDYEAKFGDAAPDLASQEAKARELRPIRRRYLLGKAWRDASFRAYDTREGVALLDHIECPSCGGAYKRRQCSCK